MKKIVIVYGGKSPESEISILTSLKVYKELSKVNKNIYLVFLDKEGNFYFGKNLLKLENYQDKKGFRKFKFYSVNNTYYFKGVKRYYFDEVLIIGHGKNIEDGTLSSYFEVNNIPYLYDDLSNASLFIDKVKTKLVLQSLNIPLIPYQIVHQFNKNIEIKLYYPIILKPSRLGSSIGIEKVNSESELKVKMLSSFRYDETLLLEEYIEDKVEYNISILGYEDKMIFSSIEEVSSSSEGLSFYDKYDYSSSNEKRLISPSLPKEIKDKILEISSKIFSSLNLCGLYRFDLIFNKKTGDIYLNEVNSLPGSLSYYLFEDRGIKMSELLLMYIDILETKNKRRNHLLVNFEEGFINNIDLDKLKK